MADMEYIERDHIVKFIENGLNNPDKVKAFGHDAAEILAEIHLAPTADVAPVVHSEWVMIPVNGVARYRCGNIDCCRLMPFGCSPGELGFCPHCGARMDGGKHD